MNFKLIGLLAIGFLIVTAIKRSALPRGIRNNNPGNIKRNDIEWQGAKAIQTDNTFVQFTKPEYGFRAMMRILRSYERRGLTTIRDIIGTYAPSTENKTDKYIQFVSDQLNVSSDQNLNLDEHALPLIKAITHFEQGKIYQAFYNDSRIQTGIQLA